MIMETKRLSTGGILGLIAIVMMYVTAILMLFLPICIVNYEMSKIGTTTLLGSGTATLTGVDYLRTSGLHIFYMVMILLFSTVSIPMFGDTQMNTRSCIVGLRCAFLCVVFAFLAAFVFDVISPLQRIGTSVKVTGFTVLNGGVLIALMAIVSIILVVVSTVLCSVETEKVRRAIFFSAQCKQWRAEEILIGTFTAICGGLVACLPYIFIKDYWKRKYGDIRSDLNSAGEPVMPSAIEKRKHSAALNYFGYAAKLLISYKTLLDNGTISQEDYDQIKQQLMSDAPVVPDTPDTDEDTTVAQITSYTTEEKYYD